MVGLISPEGCLEHILRAYGKLGPVGQSGPGAQGEAVGSGRGGATSSLQGAPEVAKVRQLLVPPHNKRPGAMPAQATLGGPRTGPGVGGQPWEAFGPHMQETMCFLFF